MVMYCTKIIYDDGFGLRIKVIYIYEQSLHNDGSLIQSIHESFLLE